MDAMFLCRLFSTRPKASFFGVCAFVLCIAAAGTAPAQVFTTARDIAAHLTPKDGKPVRISLDATVTFQDPGLTIFLYDETGATFIRGARDNPKVARGERLRIEGETHNGLIIGGIKPERIHSLFTGPAPEPRIVTPEDLASGRFHYHWISLSGVGRSLRSEDENSATLRLLADGRVMEIRFDEAPEDDISLVDAELRISGLAAGDINDRRQLVMPYVRVANMSDVEIIKAPPSDPFNEPPVPLMDLQRAIATGHRVKIAGTSLSAPIAGGVFLRDAARSVFVQTKVLDIKPGDLVEAVGFPEMGIFSVQLSDAECRVMAPGAAPTPVSATMRDLTEGTDAELIHLEAKVLQRLDRGGRSELLAQVGSFNFSVICPGLAPTEVQANALVKLTGLCRVASTKTDGYRAKPTGYNLWPRSMSDILLAHRAPWWTAQRLSLGLAGAAALALIAFVWAALLRRQVARQLAVIEAKAQREAITEERQRIAREFHDTLEQELAGLSLRLDAATPRVADEKARSLLEQQQKLLMRLQSETRDFVWDLRDSSRTDAPLDEALRSLVEHLQVNTTTPLSFESSGPLPHLPALVQHHLLRITREAVNNALKYASASAIEVTLDCQPDLLSLEISDDGRGFDLAATDALQGHFGIRGMRERARKLGAELRISSGSGGGSSVNLTLPLATR